MHRPLGDCLQQDRGAAFVDLDVRHHVVHALANTNERREMDHRIDVGERALDRVSVADIAHDELGFGVEVGGGRAGEAMNLGRKRIENPNRVTSVQQKVCDVRADKTCAACDQNPLSHWTALRKSPRRTNVGFTGLFPRIQNDLSTISAS